MGRFASIPAPGDYSVLKAVDGSDPSNIWAVGTYGGKTGPEPDDTYERLLAFQWNGKEWVHAPIDSPYSESPHYERLNAVAALAPDDVWVVGAGGDGFDYDPRIWHWNGTMWQRSENPEFADATLHMELFAISAASPNDIWTVGTSESNNGYYYPLVGHWDGTSWKSIEVPRPHYAQNSLQDVSAVSSNDVWVVGHATGATYILHWDGAYWELVPAYPGAENEDWYLYGVHALAIDNVWVAGHYWEEGHLFPLAVHWDGTAWSRQELPISDREGLIISDVTASGPDDVWMTANYYNRSVAFLLHWDGVEWTEVPHEEPGTSPNKLEAVEVFGPQDAWAVGWTRFSPESKAVIQSVRRFTDVSATDYFAGAAFCLADRGVISGYEGCSFRPGNPVSRAQLTKMVVLSAGWSEQAPGSATFADVPEGSTFYSYVETAAQHQLIGGYECGRRDGEECDAGRRPYFRPNEGVTRGQAAKIIATAAGFEDDPGAPLFSDVPTGSTFYEWVQRLAKRHVLGGYACGSRPDEPCDEQSLAYFRPGGQVTRGQAAKVVANSFFPECPATPTPK
ncbi:MAG: S-layer homology domain-containing protein [Chloroflexota bacterium]|nr:S-layer homology domain-containing protein [Chloroflexota bacterium]